MVLADSFYYQPVQIDTINTRVNADLFAKEGDANGRGMVVQITENGMIKDTTGITLRLQWSHLSVGVSGFTDFEVVDSTKGLYKVKYPTSMLHRGRVEAFIRITDNGILSGTRNLFITVERMVGSDETIEASDDFSALQTALTKLSAWEATISGKVDTWEADMEATKQLYIDTLAAAEAAYPQELVSLQQQLAEADTEIVGTNLRIDSLIIPLSPENANLEVTNARTSVVKGKAFTTLSNRIEEAEGDFKTLVDSELNENHIIRSVPNGVSDHYDSSLGVFKKNVGHTVLDCGETFDSFVSTSTNVYKMMITGWVTAENAVRGNVTTFEAVNADGTLDKIAVAIGGGGLLVNTIALSGDALHLYLEKTKVDAMVGATLLDRCKQYLASKPIDLKYQLVTGVDINLPNELSANTQWIIKAFGDLTLLSSALISENETWEV